MDNDLIQPLNIDDDRIDQEADSDFKIDDTEQVRDEFIRINLSNDQYGNNDEL